jgi:hypothetical protein
MGGGGGGRGEAGKRKQAEAGRMDTQMYGQKRTVIDEEKRITCSR